MEISSDTTNLYRPNQVEEARAELARLDATLQAPPHIRGKISDVRSMSKRQKRLKADIEKYEPRAFSSAERDAAVQEFGRLESEIKVGMLSSEEMRRNPPGAVNRHIAWENRNKGKIARWKHLGLRLAAGGDMRGDVGAAQDAVNIELLRPLSNGARSLSMEGAQIPKTAEIHIGSDPAGTVTFSMAEIEALQALAPHLAGSLAVLDNEARAEIKTMLLRAMNDPTPDDGENETPAAESEAAVESAVGEPEKPSIKDLGYNGMRKLAAAHGMESTVRAKYNELLVWLRARHLVR